MESPASREVDPVSGVTTTGHSWDDIRELNNPLPRWWLWTFYGCIAFAVGYTIAFPAWPMVSGLCWLSFCCTSLDRPRTWA